MPGTYHWFITSGDNIISQTDFEDCDIFCDSPESVEEEPFQIKFNLFGGGISCSFEDGDVQFKGTVSCSGVKSWGWKYERIGAGPVYDWRLSPYLYEIETEERTLNPYGIGPYVGRGSIRNLKLRQDDNGNWTGGIWLENQQAGASCADNVRDQMLLIDWRQANEYLEASGIEIS